MIKYLGSKRRLIPNIVEEVKKLLPYGGSVLDLFSGTSRVGTALKAEGYKVHANDNANYAFHIANCYIAASAEDYQKKAEELIADLNSTSPANEPGHFTRYYSIESQFFQKKNALRVEAIRDRISDVEDPILKSIALTSLMEAADRVDSTCGIQMAYLKKWANRSFNPLELRVPELSEGAGVATRLEAKVCAQEFCPDLVYVDPPYNQHSYLGNYHIWETLSLWDSPGVYGKARKRLDVKTRKSPFNSKRQALGAFTDVISSIQSHALLASFNDTGHITKDQILEVLRVDYKIRMANVVQRAYIGHKIGVYNREGKKVGTEGEPTTTEYLFIGRRLPGH